MSGILSVAQRYPIGAASNHKPATHIGTNQSCDSCHGTGKWKPATFTHGGVTAGSCASCHNGSSATGKPAAHIPTTGSCDSLTVSAKLLGKIGAEDTVFVMAKSVEGGGPPLAVKRFKGSDLPLQFMLDDSAAIMPGRSISQFSEVVITAKVSKSGQADQQAGDIYAPPVKAKLGTSALKVELNQQR